MLRQRQSLNREGGFAAVQTRLFCFLLLLALAMPAAARVGAGVELYLRLAESGAPQLALEGLRESSPSSEFDLTNWINWQRAELNILAKQRWWTQLLAQIENYPQIDDLKFATEVQQLRIEALIELGEFQKARDLLRKEIWNGSISNDEPIDEESPVNDVLKSWRELIVKSYISEGMSDDAYIAMQHFRDDYGVDSASSTSLLVQTLFASNFPDIAEGVLDKQPNTEENRLLKQLARLRQNRGVRSIIFSAKEKLQKGGLNLFERAMLWGMVAEAAEIQGDKASRVIALEAFLKEHPNQQIAAVFKLDSEQLWAAYDSYAQRVANREQLLRGDDNAWMDSAGKAGNMNPIHQRSIYAYLSRNSVTVDGRIKAQNMLVASLKRLKDGDNLITKLYLKQGDATLGQEVISVLLDKALKERNLERASELISLMDSPEVGNGHFVWSLRKAKIFLLAGNYVQSVEVIDRLIEGLEGISEKNRDRLIQLIFDLQTAHQDVAAVRLLKKIDLQQNDLKLHRELLYWIADSNMALENYRLAAQGYLESAIVPGIDTMDPWAQTARYQAAKALLKAELKGDAKAIYEQLLKFTKNPSRRALLKQELEQIHL